MPAEQTNSLANIFHPASIAVVGASSSASETGWVRRLRDFGYQGKIYPINPKTKEIYGLKAYPAIRVVPAPVAYAILNIPAAQAPQAIRDCAAKGIKFVHCYAAGFIEQAFSALPALLKGEFPENKGVHVTDRVDP